MHRAQTLDKLKSYSADQKVYIGGLKHSTTWKQLEKHVIETTGSKPKLTEALKDKGYLAFGTADEALTAITVLAGSELDGAVLEADVWTGGGKKDGDGKKIREPKTKEQRKAKWERRKERKHEELANDPDFILKQKVIATPADCKAWVGGLKETTTAAKIQAHFKGKGCKVALVKPLKEGSACVTFPNEQERNKAVSLAGTFLDGQAIQVDAWQTISPEERAAERAAKKAKVA